MPMPTSGELPSLNTEQQGDLLSYLRRAAAAIDVAGTIPPLRRTDLQSFDTEEEDGLRKVIARLLPTGYLTWAGANRRLAERDLIAFETHQVRDLSNFFTKYATYLTEID